MSFTAFGVTLQAYGLHVGVLDVFFALGELQLEVQGHGERIGVELSRILKFVVLKNYK